MNVIWVHHGFHAGELFRSFEELEKLFEKCRKCEFLIPIQTL